MGEKLEEWFFAQECFRFRVQGRGNAGSARAVTAGEGEKAGGLRTEARRIGYLRKITEPGAVPPASTLPPLPPLREPPSPPRIFLLRFLFLCLSSIFPFTSLDTIASPCNKKVIPTWLATPPRSRRRRQNDCAQTLAPATSARLRRSFPRGRTPGAPSIGNSKVMCSAPATRPTW